MMVIENRKSPNAKRGKRHSSTEVNERLREFDRFEAVNITASTTAICPDLLTLDDIGEADNLRGRAVRAFFWAMRLWRV